MQGMLSGLAVVLVHTRFPENIGMAARACANMGCPELCLVEPELWDWAKATPLATSQGHVVLNEMRMVHDLETALADRHLVIASTARTGGWRRDVLDPAKCAQLIARAIEDGKKAALVFGPEDRGLCNDEILCAQHICHIPCEDGARSLNLAQAVLLLLYECSKAKRALEISPPHSGKWRKGERPINSQENDRLLDDFKSMLLSLDVLHGANPDYFMLPWRSLFNRAQLRRHEYDALMGLCRQVRQKLSR